jgi:hypothetical protein
MCNEARHGVKGVEDLLHTHIEDILYYKRPSYYMRTLRRNASLSAISQLCITTLDSLSQEDMLSETTLRHIGQRDCRVPSL